MVLIHFLMLFSSFDGRETFGNIGSSFISNNVYNIIHKQNPSWPKDQLKRDFRRNPKWGERSSSRPTPRNLTWQRQSTSRPAQTPPGGWSCAACRRSPAIYHPPVARWLWQRSVRSPPFAFVWRPHCHRCYRYHPSFPLWASPGHWPPLAWEAPMMMGGRHRRQAGNYHRPMSGCHVNLSVSSSPNAKFDYQM